MAGFRVAGSVSGMRDKPQAFGCGQQAPVASPQLAAAGQSDRSEQVCVDVADTEPMERHDVDHALNFIVGCRDGDGEIVSA